MQKNILFFRVLAFLMVYLLLKFMGGSFGALLLYPITILVAFLHEFGHALGAILTGGAVEGIQISADGSGYTKTRGGSPGIILMGGYLGSAILGNILFRIGARHFRLAQSTLMAMAVFMVFSGLFWFESFESTAILWLFAASLFYIGLKTQLGQDVLMFLGLAAVLHVIQDFNVGPSSDLKRYGEVVGIFSEETWMYIWLIVAALIFYINISDIVQGRRRFS